MMSPADTETNRLTALLAVMWPRKASGTVGISLVACTLLFIACDKTNAKDPTDQIVTRYLNEEKTAYLYEVTMCRGTQCASGAYFCLVVECAEAKGTIVSEAFRGTRTGREVRLTMKDEIVTVNVHLLSNDDKTVKRTERAFVIESPTSTFRRAIPKRHQTLSLTDCIGLCPEFSSLLLAKLD